MARILIVDDDLAFRDSLKEMLQDLRHTVLEAGSTSTGLHVLRTEKVDVAIVDLRLPDSDGLDFLQRAAQYSSIPYIMLTAYASGNNTIKAMRLGAFDHLTKPVSRSMLIEVLTRALQQVSTLESAEKEKTTEDSFADEELISSSEVMRQVFKRIGLAASSDATVLILGETGTGKELVAKALHRNSARAAQPFVAVNCAAIPAELIESELFGHVKGAFTGAVNDRPGRFRDAQGGTLFLDEIGDMPLSTQAKILRTLQEHELTPLGGNQVVSIDVRIVAATHRDLPTAVKEGRFREDLWYRLQVLPIVLPPLRERLSDVLPLAEHFLRRHGGDHPKRLTASASRLLLAHDWPGNVRELRNAIERAVVLCHGGFIDAEHIDLQQHASSALSSDIDWNATMADAIAGVERKMIERALAATAGNRSETARRLGLSRQQLYRKLAELKLD